MPARNLEQGEMWSLNIVKASANEAHSEYMRRLQAMEAFKALVENKYGSELNMETGLLRSEDSPT